MANRIYHSCNGIHQTDNTKALPTHTVNTETRPTHTDGETGWVLGWSDLQMQCILPGFSCYTASRSKDESYSFPVLFTPTIFASQKRNFGVRSAPTLWLFYTHGTAKSIHQPVILNFFNFPLQNGARRYHLENVGYITKGRLSQYVILWGSVVQNQNCK